MHSLCTQNPVLQGTPAKMPQLLVFNFQSSSTDVSYSAGLLPHCGETCILQLSCVPHWKLFVIPAED